MIRYLVATTDGQGHRPSDFFRAEPHEPVWFPPSLHEDHDTLIDGECPCARIFIGARSGGGTTTARIADLDVTPETLTEQLWSVQGYFGRDEIRRDLDNLLRVIKTWPLDAVVDRRGPLRLEVRFEPEDVRLWRGAHEKQALATIAAARASGDGYPVPAYGRDPRLEQARLLTEISLG